jgi:phosphoserine phosphatase
LTDSEIPNQVEASHKKIKRQLRELIKYFEKRNIKVWVVCGKVVVSGPNSYLLRE